MMRIFTSFIGLSAGALAAAVSSFALPVPASQHSEDLINLVDSELQEDTPSPSTPASVLGWQNIPPLQPPATPSPGESLPNLNSLSPPLLHDVT